MTTHPLPTGVTQEHRDIAQKVMEEIHDEISARFLQVEELSERVAQMMNPNEDEEIASEEFDFTDGEGSNYEYISEHEDEYLKPDQFNCGMISMDCNLPPSPPPKPPRTGIPYPPGASSRPDIITTSVPVIRREIKDPTLIESRKTRTKKRRPSVARKICCPMGRSSADTTDEDDAWDFKLAERTSLHTGPNPVINQKQKIWPRREAETKWTYERAPQPSNYVLYTYKKTTLPARQTVQIELIWPDCPIKGGNYEFQVIQAFKRYKKLQTPNFLVNPPADNQTRRENIHVMVHNPSDEDVVLGCHTPFGYAKAL